MNRRRALVTLALSLVTLVLHVVLVRAMAHGHVAHVLLGSGNAAPPLGAAALAISLVLVRLGAVVLAVTVTVRTEPLPALPATSLTEAGSKTKV